MESLESLKFEKLNSHEMAVINGGGWRVEQSYQIIMPDGGCGIIVHLQRYNIFGNPTGEWETKQINDK